MKNALAPAQWTTACTESARVRSRMNAVAAGKSFSAAWSRVNWLSGNWMLARQSSSHAS
jgi:hypothetical protein